MTELSELSQEDLLVAAIRETREAAAEYGWDDYSTTFALGQLYSGTVKGNPDQEAIWSRETAPTQASLDLHLTEGSVDGHTAPAENFAKMVAGIADATKEISKRKLDRKRYTSPVRVRGAGIGSVRLVLEIEPHADDKRDDSMGDLSTVDSESLRAVASILASADLDDANSPLTAQISRLPAAARSALRKVATQIAGEQWHVGGKVEQRGFLPAVVAVSPAGAKRLQIELTHTKIDPKDATMFGRIDGTIDIERIVWFRPEGQQRFRAVAVDRETAEAALDLQKGHPRVMAKFVVYEALGRGDDVVRRSWELTSVQAAPEDRADEQGVQQSLEIEEEHG